MNQDKNYISADLENEIPAYSSSIRFTAYEFKLLDNPIYISIGEKFLNDKKDITGLNLWKNLFSRLNKGDNLDSVIEDFVVDIFKYEKMPFVNRKDILSFYTYNKSIFNLKVLEDIQKFYKIALRDKNINSILGE
jgi:hypothetical protein